MRSTLEDSLAQDVQFPPSKIKGCILPWMHMYGGLQGNFRLCCFADYLSDPITLGTHENSLLDVWNGEAYKKVRLDFLNGKIPSECIEACYDKQKQGAISNREQVNSRFSKFQYLQEQTNEDGSVDNKPSYLDIRFGNLCNFKCRICGPASSTSWYRDWHDDSYKKTLDYFSNNEVFWKDIPEISPHLEDVYFAGGEPFVQDGHYRLLKELIDGGYSKNISLQYNTNLSYSKYKDHSLSDLWSNFKNVQLWPSIEGWGKQAEYSRKGLDFEVFEKNFHLYRKHISSISSVVSIYTIGSMPNLIIWCKKNKVDYFGNVLILPNFQTVTSLPKESKMMLLDMYKKFIHKYKPILNDYDIEQMTSWLKFMTSSDTSDLLPLFKKEQVRLDLLRNESFEDVYPEYAEWYKNI